MIFVIFYQKIVIHMVYFTIYLLYFIVKQITDKLTAKI